MALDPAFRAFLQTPGMQLMPPPPGVTPAMMRAASQQLVPQLEPLKIHSVREIVIPGPAGDLRVRVYSPSSATNLPLILYFHGGGFVLGDLDGHDPSCRALAIESQCALASVDYRLAPETRFPGPLEDCYEAFALSGKRRPQLRV